MNDFETRINALELGLFQYVLSQTTDGDKRSLLSIQRAMREANRETGYVYLEIGSYMGGSLQPHLPDPLCRKIISIDSRPASLPDCRGTYTYSNNTTENMLRGLARVSGADLAKIRTFETGAEALDPASVEPRPDLCFIDGEHTDEAVLRDSRFCQSVLKGAGWIVYHDANIVYNGLSAFVAGLRQSGVPFRACNFEDSVFLIELGAGRLSESPLMQEPRRTGANGYLWSLRENDLYRKFYGRRCFKVMRWLKCRTWDRVSGTLKSKGATGC